MALFTSGQIARAVLSTIVILAMAGIGAGLPAGGKPLPGNPFAEYTDAYLGGRQRTLQGSRHVCRLHTRPSRVSFSIPTAICLQKLPSTIRAGSSTA